MAFLRHCLCSTIPLYLRTENIVLESESALSTSESRHAMVHRGPHAREEVDCLYFVAPCTRGFSGSPMLETTGGRPSRQKKPQYCARHQPSSEHRNEHWRASAYRGMPRLSEDIAGCSYYFASLYGEGHG